MPVDLKAPYAPASTVINAIRHFRDKGLPIVIDTNFLVRIGISASLKNWVFGTFKFLDLITDDGKPTESFEALRKASDHDYSGILAGLLKEAYRLVFEIVPMPAESTRRAIDTAFKDYQPHAQRARMMALFLGLCLEAKLIPEGFDSKSISSKPRASSPRRVQKTRSNEAASMAQKVTPVNQPQHKPETFAIS